MRKNVNSDTVNLVCVFKYRECASVHVDTGICVFVCVCVYMHESLRVSIIVSDQILPSAGAI